MDQSLVSLAVAEKYLLFVHSFDHQLRGLRLPHGKDTACGRGRESRAGATGRGHRDMGDLGWHLKCNHLEPGLCGVPGVRNLLKDTGNFRFGLSTPALSQSLCSPEQRGGGKTFCLATSMET